MPQRRTTNLDVFDHQRRSNDSINLHFRCCFDRDKFQVSCHFILDVASIKININNIMITNSMNYGVVSCLAGEPSSITLLIHFDESSEQAIIFISFVQIWCSGQTTSLVIFNRKWSRSTNKWRIYRNQFLTTQWARRSLPENCSIYACHRWIPFLVITKTLAAHSRK